jgi:hypothetical protein
MKTHGKLKTHGALIGELMDIFILEGETHVVF